MNLCIDQGNSSAKIAVFEGDTLVELIVIESLNISELQNILDKYNVENCIISSVISDNIEINDFLNANVDRFIRLNHLTPIPVNNKYLTPETLGKDRLAAVVAADYLNPGSNNLVIDAGTAITFDFIDSNKNYLGGNIAPGLDMRLAALHQFTDKLPLVKAKAECQLLGNDTESALLGGAISGVVFEIDGYINELRNKYSQLSVFLTGGSIFYFDNKLKNAIFAEKNLVLIGLNRILQYNV